MKKLKYIIPNGITAINILSGSFSVILTLEGYIWLPVYFLLIAAGADMLDGLSAKLLKATSEFGKQLDSIADVISFGLAPSVLTYKILIMVFVIKRDGTFLLEEAEIWERAILFSAFTLVVFAALRLARFNIQSVSGTDFVGLPVPANALFVVAIWIIIHEKTGQKFHHLILNFYFVAGVIALLSFLMVSKIPMISLKFEGRGIRLNIWRYLLILGAVILFLIFGITSLLFIMVFYFLLSVLKVLFAKNPKPEGININ